MTIGLTLGVAAAAQAQPPSALLVLDPRVLPLVGAAQLAGAAGDAGIALAAGAEAGGCAGWQLLRQPGEASPASLPATAATGRFAPDAALRAARQWHADGEAPGRMVLVAAGGPQCISVACSLSRDMAAGAQPVRVDVLALAAGAERLRCVADNTGGLFRHVPPAQAANALAALLLPKGPPATAAAPPARPEPITAATVPSDTGKAAAAAAPPPQRGSTRSGVPIPRSAPRRQADLQAGLAATDAGRSQTNAPGPLRALAWADPADPAATDVLPGAPEPAVDSWPKSAPPAVRLQAVPALGEPPLASELAYEVLAVDGDGAYRLVGRSWAPRPVFTLPAGAYVARVSYGGVVREYRFKSRGKGLEHQTLPLDIGYVALKTVAAPGASPLLSDLHYTVRRLDGGTPVEREDAQPLVTLPAGAYEITVASGPVRSSATVRVAPGKTVAQTFDLGLGYLRLRFGLPGDGPIAFRIEPVDTAGADDAEAGSNLLADITTDGRLAPLLRLPAGRHLAIAEQNGRAVRQLVTVAPGRLTQVTLEPQTARADFGLGTF